MTKAKGLDEAAAYGELRRLAMDRRGKRLADIAQALVDAAELLEGSPSRSASRFSFALQQGPTASGVPGSHTMYTRPGVRPRVLRR